MYRSLASVYVYMKIIIHEIIYYQNRCYNCNRYAFRTFAKKKKKKVIWFAIPDSLVINVILFHSPKKENYNSGLKTAAMKPIPHKMTKLVAFPCFLVTVVFQCLYCSTVSIQAFSFYSVTIKYRHLLIAFTER